MQFERTFALAALFVGALFAQTPADELKSKVGSVRYPPLAEAARVQGDVHLHLNSGAVTLLSGHVILAQIAVDSAKAFGSIEGGMDIDVTYHFVLADTTSVPASTTVKRGNAFGRAVLRMFGFQTEKVALDHRCQEGAPPANDLTLSGATIEIWIYGRSRCIQTNVETLSARR